MKGRPQARSTRTVGDTVLAWLSKHTIDGVRVRDTSRAPKKIHVTPKNLHWSNAKRAEAASIKFGKRSSARGRTPEPTKLACKFCDWYVVDLLHFKQLYGTVRALSIEIVKHIVEYHNVKLCNLMKSTSLDRLTRRI